ncbi:DUF1028 domain-containing protein [Enterovirga aerilata]|uniref:DUF1028 domain-containing protein n=1 Tax=Enterovirga aerilata TaxID=2730920 RepID=A0A849I6J3_9HYPH|nr:DUF1028 domain-containing protein [Enterovirga sp. DB1703]NNM71710.1 DUF1028 domain-containing protein [Enterovirga sp. DB1703]
MTWSIVARDPERGQIGIAVATCAFAVGSRVPFVETGVGAVATQAMANPLYGPRGLALLKAGAAPEEAIRELTTADEGRADRQLHLMAADGRNAAYTGAACVPWCGHEVREGFSVAGNMLAGPEVVAETISAFERSAGRPLFERLLLALLAGEAAGGDRRGRQSAAMLIHDAEEYALVDIRVDDHPDPLAELARLLEVWKGRPRVYREALPSRARPSGIVGRDAIEQFIAERLAAEDRAGPGPAVA